MGRSGEAGNGSGLGQEKGRVNQTGPVKEEIRDTLVPEAWDIENVGKEESQGSMLAEAWDKDNAIEAELSMLDPSYDLLDSARSRGGDPGRQGDMGEEGGL